MFGMTCLVGLIIITLIFFSPTFSKATFLGTQRAALTRATDQQADRAGSGTAGGGLVTPSKNSTPTSSSAGARR